MENSHVRFSFGERAGEIQRWPFRLAAIAEFLPQVYETGKPETRSFHAAIDKDNFNDVMAKANLRLRFDLKNPLSDQPKEWTVDLTLREFKSLRPEYIAETAPELSHLVGVRALLNDLAQRKVGIAQFREQIRSFSLPPDLLERITDALYPPPETTRKPAESAPPKPRPEPESGGTLDSILEMVDTGEESTTRAEAKERVQSALDDFLGTDRGGGETINSVAVQKAVAHTDVLLSRAVNAIAHHPEFQRLEAVWRGLKFLVDQTDFRKNIRLEIVHAGKDRLIEVFARDIYQAEHDGLSEIPLAAVVAAYEFDCHAPDIDQLRDLAQKAEQLPLTVIASVGASFFNLTESAKLNELPYLGSLLEQPDYVKFNGLREEPSSRWVTLCFNRFLLRYPYGHEGWKVKAFDFRENTPTEADYLWGNPVWAIAGLLVRSYGRLGWATQISGRRNGGLIENLPVRGIRLPNGDEANLPLEAPIPDRRLEEFDRAGIIPLVCDINSDAAYVLASPTLHRPAHEADPAKAERNAFAASLPYHMYVGDIARFINRKQAELTSGFDAGEIETRFSRALAAFNVTRDELAEPGFVHVQAQQSASRPGKMELLIEVSSPKRVLHGRAATQMVLPLRG